MIYPYHRLASIEPHEARHYGMTCVLFYSRWLWFCLSRNVHLWLSIYKIEYFTPWLSCICITNHQQRAKRPLGDQYMSSPVFFLYESPGCISDFSSKTRRKNELHIQVACVSQVLFIWGHGFFSFVRKLKSSNTQQGCMGVSVIILLVRGYNFCWNITNRSHNVFQDLECLLIAKKAKWNPLAICDFYLRQFIKYTFRINLRM